MISRMVHPIFFICFLLGANTFATNLSWANDKDGKEMAKKHFQAGLLLLDVENYVVAAEEFQKSLDLYPTKTGYFNLASCHRELGNFTKAIQIINKLKVDFAKELDSKWQKEITAFEESVAANTIEVQLNFNVSGATIRVGGQEMGKTPLSTPLLLPPGEHKIAVYHEEYKELIQPIILMEGEQEPKTIALTLEKKSADVDPNWETKQNIHFQGNKEKDSGGKKRVWTWVAYGICGAAGISAIVTGALNLAWTDEVKKECGGTNCRPSLKDEVQTVQRLGTATNVLIGISATTLILGTILLFAEDSNNAEDDKFVLAPMMSPGGGGLSISATF